jgi:hypothetical protein
MKSQDVIAQEPKRNVVQSMTKITGQNGNKKRNVIPVRVMGVIGFVVIPVLLRLQHRVQLQLQCQVIHRRTVQNMMDARVPNILLIFLITTCARGLVENGPVNNFNANGSVVER